MAMVEVEEEMAEALSMKVDKLANKNVKKTMLALRNVFLGVKFRLFYLVSLEDAW